MSKYDQNKSRVQPQLDNCMLSILVPAFNESIETIDRLLNSITYQQNINQDDFEILIIVNNDLRSRTTNEVFKNNQKVLNKDWALKYKNKLNISVYDHSSVGHEIPTCSIGAARDILLNYAYSRYQGTNYNGIIMHIDADVYFKDSLLLSKYLDIFKDSSVIGVIGGKWREVFTEDCPGFAHEQVKNAFKIIGLSKQCKELSNFIKGKSVLDAFGGSNMLARCYESLKIGGFKHINFEEDKEFGYRLKEYAANHGMKIVNKRTELKVVAELRVSNRTGSSISNDINTLLAGGSLRMKHPHKSNEYLEINTETYEFLVNKVKLLVGGDELMTYIEDYGELWIHKSRKIHLTSKARNHNLEPTHYQAPQNKYY